MTREEEIQQLGELIHDLESKKYENGLTLEEQEQYREAHRRAYELGCDQAAEDSHNEQYYSGN